MRGYSDKEEWYWVDEEPKREKSIRKTETDELEFIENIDENWLQAESEESGMGEQYFSAPRDKNLAARLIEGKRQEAERARDSRKEIEDRRKIYIDIIIDGTYSFAKIFPKVNYVIERIIRMVQEEKSDFLGIDIKYGLTVLHEKAEPYYFSDKKCFTESEDELLQKILDIRFYGGSINGREDLKDALDTGLSVLNNYAEKDAYRGVLMFSDSLPEEENMHPDFFMEVQDGYINKGLRFAIIYTYDDQFTPKLKMVGRKERIVENGKNDIIYGSIKELLSSDGDGLTEKIRRVVSDILKQTSVRI